MSDGGLHAELKIPAQFQSLVQRPLTHQLVRGSAPNGFLILEFNQVIYRYGIYMTREDWESPNKTGRYARYIQDGIRVIAERIRPVIEELKKALPDDTERYDHDV